MPSKTIYKTAHFSDFKDEFGHAMTSLIGKRRFNTSTKLRSCFLYLHGQNFMDCNFYTSSFSVTLNGVYAGKIVRLEGRWNPGVDFEKAKYRTMVYVYYHVREDGKYKPQRVIDMVFRGFLYSLFIQAAIDFNKVSANVVREIFEHSGIETEDFHISAIVVLSSLRLSANTYEFDLLANRHYATLNSQFFARHFEFKNIMHDTNTYKVLSFLLDKRFGQTELQEHLVNVFARHFSNE